MEGKGDVANAMRDVEMPSVPAARDNDRMRWLTTTTRSGMLNSQ